MAFPGNYNISYYRGDTYEFNVYPKTSSGATFDLDGYTTAGFYLATERGSSTTIECSATINQDSSGLWYVSCVIKPSVGLALDSAIQYVYDVEVLKPASGATGSYPYRYTLLTGTLSVTDHVGQVEVA
jgi:hypothetical protein